MQAYILSDATRVFHDKQIWQIYQTSQIYVIFKNY